MVTPKGQVLLLNSTDGAAMLVHKRRYGCICPGVRRTLWGSCGIGANTLFGSSLNNKEVPMTPPASAIRLIGHQRRFAESIAQIDTELEFASGAAVAARREEVVAAARAAYGPSEDFRGVRDAWDAVFPDGVYSATGLAEAKRLA
jgi:hypothetical protein